MKRRKFLALAGIGGLLAGVTSFTIIGNSFEDAAADLIYNELSFLKLDKAGVKKFAREYADHKNKVYKLSIRGYSLLGIKSSKSGKVNQLITTYLLSTDFFRNQMDESRVVNYIGLYDPYTRPCSHPFNHHYYDVETA